MRTQRTLRHPLGAAAVAAVTLFSVPAVGDAAVEGTTLSCTLAEPEVRSGPADRDAVRGEELRTEAYRALEEEADAKRAAELLDASIALRPPCDARLFDDLRLSARLHHAVGEAEKARLTMLRAAEHAVETGHVVGAAHAYLDAATIAVERGLQAEAADAVRRADLLSTSPLLGARDRELIAQRIVRDRGMQAAVSG